MSNENELKIINAIKEGFNITIDHTRNLVILDEDLMPSGTVGWERKSADGSFRKIFSAILEYIENHPNEFELGDLCHQNLLGNTERAWWSPLPAWEGSIIALGSNSGQTRLIKHVSGNVIHPAALTKLQYRLLKVKIPNTCWVEDCSDNYYPTLQISNKRCYFHRLIRNTAIIQRIPSLDDIFGEEGGGGNGGNHHQQIDLSFVISRVEKHSSGGIVINAESTFDFQGKIVRKIFFPENRFRESNFSRVDTSVYLDLLLTIKGVISNPDFVVNDTLILDNSDYRYPRFLSIILKDKESLLTLYLNGEEEFQKIRKINLDLEKKNLFNDTLSRELSNIVDENNGKIFSEAKRLGLVNFDKISPRFLASFSIKKLLYLDEEDLLTSSYNSTRSNRNSALIDIRIKNEKEIRKIAEDNKIKLEQAKKSDKNNNSSQVDNQEDDRENTTVDTIIEPTDQVDVDDKFPIDRPNINSHSHEENLDNNSGSNSGSAFWIILIVVAINLVAILKLKISQKKLTKRSSK